MGAGHSSDANAYTYIETEDSNFSPGAWVSGVVKILVEKPTSMGQMNILLTCVSESRWSEAGYDPKYISYDKRILSRTYFRILSMEDQLSQGHFEIPFNIQLPINLIPSFTYDEHALYGKIEYFFEAVADNYKDFQSLKNVVWMNKLPDPNQPIGPISDEASIQVNTCCCLKKGQASLKATLSTNLALTTDDLFTTIKLDNSMNKCTLNKISCILVRHMRLKARNHLYKNSKFFTSDCIGVARDVQILPGQSDVPDVIISLSLKDEADLWMMPTVASELIDCEYFLKVKLGFDNLLEFELNEVDIPLGICNLAMVLNQSLSARPEVTFDWSPTMLAMEPVKVLMFDHVNGETQESPRSDNMYYNEEETDRNFNKETHRNLNKVVPETV
jgi:hypothetical protein